MSSIDDLMAQIPIDQVAGRLGVDRDEADTAVRQALPALLGGMQANAADPGGEASLSEAIGQHRGGLLDGGVDLDQVDTDDGEKIVGHVFGDQQDQVVNQLGGLGGGAGMMAKLLPMLAPIVMAFLAKSVLGRKDGGGDAQGDDDGGGLGGLLGGDGGGGLGGMLGGLLGGSGGGLGDVLGGLLGGGRKG